MENMQKFVTDELHIPTENDSVTAMIIGKNAGTTA